MELFQSTLQIYPFPDIQNPMRIYTEQSMDSTMFGGNAKDISTGLGWNACDIFSIKRGPVKPLVSTVKGPIFPFFFIHV
jgi:hypothetical protein